MFLPARLGMSVSGLKCTPLGLIARPDMLIIVKFEWQTWTHASREVI